MTDEISKIIKERGFTRSTIAEIFKKFYEAKIKFKTEKAAISRKKSFDDFIDYMLKMGDMIINTAQTDEELSEQMTREMRERLGERWRPEDVTRAVEEIRPTVPEYIVIELPRPSQPGMPYRLTIDQDGKRHWRDFVGNEVMPPSIQEVPITPFVPEGTPPIMPELWKTPTQQMLIRRITARDFKMEVIREQLQRATELRDKQKLWGRIGGYTGWQKKDRENLTFAGEHNV